MTRGVHATRPTLFFLDGVVDEGHHHDAQVHPHHVRDGEPGTHQEDLQVAGAPTSASLSSLRRSLYALQGRSPPVREHVEK